MQLYFWIVWLLLEENNRNKNAKLKIKKQEKTQEDYELLDHNLNVDPNSGSH